MIYRKCEVCGAPGPRWLAKWDFNHSEKWERWVCLDCNDRTHAMLKEPGVEVKRIAVHYNLPAWWVRDVRKTRGLEVSYA